MKNEFFVFVGNLLYLFFRYFFGSLFQERDVSKLPYVPYDFGNRSNLGAINQNDDDDDNDDD